MTQPALEFGHIDKSFFGAKVLKDISFAVPSGAIVGLVGENGAGKSTLVNILSGIFPADAGWMKLNGIPFTPQRPVDSAQAGIALAHQELNLFPNLSAAENLFIADFPKQGPESLSWIDRENLRSAASELLKQVNLDVEPGTLVEELSPGQKQLLEIAKALKGDPLVVAFDEPTTSLTQPEAEQLFTIIRRLKERGIGVIYISHNLGDVMRLCDQVVVLRDGEIQGAGDRESLTIPDLIQLMVGRELETFFPRRTSAPQDEPVMQVHSLSQPGIVRDVNFTLRRGEILGVSGLMGSGRTELARILFGLDTYQDGQILVEGEVISAPAPRKCVDLGMAFLTEDRKMEGLLPSASIEENVALVGLQGFGSRLLGVLKKAILRARVEEVTRELSVDCRSLDRQPVQTLSGGNQQKVVLGKWLLGGSRILLLDEPTRGVDVGARYEIYEKLVELADEGVSMIVISSDLEELVGLCDRILVMSVGEIRSSVDRKDFDRKEMLQSAFGKERLT